VGTKSIRFFRSWLRGYEKTRKTGYGANGSFFFPGLAGIEKMRGEPNEK
jgi:hypothetical protein